MKVAVDESRCTGHGRCYAVAPQLFAPDEEGYNSARGSHVSIDAGSLEAARQTVKVCPEDAITVIDATEDGEA
jgi:ferredoxin